MRNFIAFVTGFALFFCLSAWLMSALPLLPGKPGQRQAWQQAAEKKSADDAAWAKWQREHPRK
jgi:hypothetical protein